MLPEQIGRVAKIMANDPEIMAILRGGGKNVERGIQKGVSKGVELQRKREKVMVGGDPK